MIYESDDKGYRWRDIEKDLSHYICRGYQDAFEAVKEFMKEYLEIMEKELEGIFPGACFDVEFSMGVDLWLRVTVSLENDSYLLWKSGKSQEEWDHMQPWERKDSIGDDRISYVGGANEVKWGRLPTTYAFYNEHKMDLAKYGIGVGGSSYSLFIHRK